MPSADLRSFCQPSPAATFRGATKDFVSNAPRITPDAFTGGIMPRGLGKRRLIGGAVISLVITLLLSLGAVYALNRYLGSVEELGWTTGGLRR
jgi:hypothetical protein